MAVWHLSTDTYLSGPDRHGTDIQPLLAHDKISDHQAIEPRVVKTSDGFPWMAYNRLILDIQRGIQQHILAGSIPERLNELPIALVHVAIHCLRPHRSIHMDDRRDSWMLVGSDVERGDHEAFGTRTRQIVLGSFCQN